MKSLFAIKRVMVKANGVTYPTFRLTGYLHGQRVRKQFKSQEEALGERNRLEVAAANADGAISTVLTRLSEAQVSEAEACFRRLDGKSLSGALDWYFANYRPPCVDKPLADAILAFLEDRKPDVELVHWNDVRRRLNAFSAAFPGRIVQTITAAEVLTYLSGRGWAAKSFNSARGTLHTFFDFCVHDDRRWALTNPTGAIKKKKVVHGLPQIETADRIAELMAYVEAYSGGPRSDRKPGFLAPYFALATFGGLRPSIPNGEIWKLGSAANLSRLVNSSGGVIHVTPEIAKTDSIRQVKIRPNLAAWLARYPLDRYPVVMTNMQALVTEVRKKFALTDDILRHTYISMHVAKFKSLGEAALEAGNSETVIRKHYLNLASEADAEKFWAIVPTASA